MRSANAIRKEFIDFFVSKHGHTFVPSSSVVPLDDPTLLFTNAGMNQFKDVFLGIGKRPYQRAVNSQKCIRASGKHNDLEDVGRDTYHHTFFEMLGNWSFGNYYKEEAIRWAWELLTKVWGIDKSRLHATVFGGAPEDKVEADEEAYQLWKKATDINPGHIHRFGKKDNFWVMGETGPCGPCTEIHIDLTPDGSGGPLVNKGDARVMEIWNLVFIQYDRPAPGASLELLPAKHVDTGMGFERVTSVLQGKTSNYDTDVFTPLMDAIGDVVKAKYTGILEDQKDTAFRVLADHLRMLTFSLTDKAEFGNKGRGSVVRSVLRRAVRFGWQVFGQRSPFIYQLVPALVHHMGDAFPELKVNPDRVAEQIKNEEADFLRTIERGLNLFEDAAKAGEANKIISGKSVFDLFTTYGFPPDLTRQMAQERSMSIDEGDYQARLKEHEEISKSKKLAAAQSTLKVSTPLPSTNDRPKWSGSSSQGKIIGWIADNTFHTMGALHQRKSAEESLIGLLLDSTCFYAEAGGQVGDSGTIRTPTGIFAVSQTLKMGEATVHIGELAEGHVFIGQTAELHVSPQRDQTRKNHTATHLVHWALQKVLGVHIEQRGSMVNPQKLTFDFAHSQAMTAGEKADVEKLVNERIQRNDKVAWRELPIAEAKQLPGVRAFFGDKYGDTVRVVEIGDGYSREFCGGTHLDQTGAIGYFKIVSEEATGKGIRRITALTGPAVIAHMQQQDEVVSKLLDRFRCQVTDLPSRIDRLQEDMKKLQQQLKKGTGNDLAATADKLFQEAKEIQGVKIIVGEVAEGSALEAVRTQLDRLRQMAKSCVIILGWPESEEKVTLIAAVTEDVVAKGVQAGKLISTAAVIVGGKGGGKPTLAQAGGKEPAKLAEALEAARKQVEAILG